MNTSTPANATSADTGEAVAPPRPGDPSSGAGRRRHWRRWTLLAVCVLVIAAVILAFSTHLFGRTTTAAPGVTDTTAATSLATVSQRDLSAQTQVDATLGYAGSYSVINQAAGTITALPAVGQLVQQGQVLYRVDGKPVVLLYGSTPAYRSLSAGADASDVTGRDVAELNADLVALGYATHAHIPAGSDEFTWQTTAAVERLQKALGLTQNGSLGLGQVVFLPTEARITAVPATLGAPAHPGQPLLSATSTTRQVSIALDADQLSEVAVGDKVTITLPDGQTTPGAVSSVGTVATAPAAGSTDSFATIPVEVTLKDPKAAGRLDQAPVTVSITTSTTHNALVVPVTALLALSGGGGYAVDVVSGDGLHHLVAVTPGLFDDADGLVQVTRTSISAGAHVVVPSS